MNQRVVGGEASGRFGRAWFAGLFLALLSLVAVGFSAEVSAGDGSAEEGLAAAEREVDRQHLRQIYDAVQAYRKRHGDLPPWLSDLVPEFLSDPSVLVSPVERRTGESQTWGYGDPKLKCSYVYEFSQAEAGGDRDRTATLTMKEWKTRQMEEFGPAIPLLRCHLHDPVLNLSFSGDLYETGLFWETDTNTAALMQRVGLGPGAREGRWLKVKAVAAETSEPIEGARVEARNRRSELGSLPPRDGVTDGQGEYALNLGGKQPEGLSLRVAKAGCASLSIEWEGGDVPDEWVAQLSPATTIGGVIRSESGGEVAGALVTVVGTTRDAVGQVVPVEFGRATSDASGRWECDTAPRGFEELSFQVTHAEYRAGRFEQESAENDTTNVVASAALAGRTAVLRLEPAFGVTGVLRNGRQEPVAGTVILLHGEDLGERQEVQTARDGRFRFWLPDPGQAVISARAPDWAPQGQEIEVARDLEPLDVVLDPGRPVRGRVRDAEGRPLSGVVVESMPEARLAAAQWQATTDAEGRFRWEHAPRETLQISATNPGYQTVYVEAEAQAQAEVEIRLERAFRFHGKVRDAETGAPVTRFRVVRGHLWGEEADEAIVYWQPETEVQGGDGSFDLTFDDGGSGVKILIVAEGYRPGVSAALASNGWHTNEFALEKGQGPHGQVVTAEGRPVEGAQVALLGMDSFVLGQAALTTSDESTDLVTQTDADGRFVLPASLPSPTIVAVHAAGYGEVEEKALMQSGKVTLQPWGRVEGVLRLSGKPAPDQQVFLMSGQEDPGRLQYDAEVFRARTDEAGRFEFTHVPPGSQQLVRLVSMGFGGWRHSHRKRIEVPSGGTLTLTYGGQGRPVIGRVVPTTTRREIRWEDGYHALSSRLPRRPDELKTPEEMRDWMSSAEVKAAREQALTYPVSFGVDGTFRIEDVVPGTYDLRLQFHETDEDGNRLGPPIGTVNCDVVVPDEPSVPLDNPFDVGDVKLSVRFSLRVGEEAPAFTVQTLDDQTLKLESLRGKHVLLDFWAVWCAPCREELPHLKAVHHEFASRDGFAMISLNLDPDRAAPAAYVKREGMIWPQGLLGEWSKAELPGLYGVFGLPATFLIGPDGKVVARGLRGPMILEAVRAAMGE